MPTPYSEIVQRKFLDSNGLTYFARKLNNYPTNEVIEAVIEGVQDELDEKADKTSTVNSVTYDASGKKIQKVINNVTSDVVSVATLKSDMNFSKSDIGLANVENKSSEMIRGELTSSNVTTALGYTPMNSALKGANSGVAELDATGKVPISQLPASLDDVLEYSNLTDFPASGESGKIYIDTTTNKSYRWNGTTYVFIASPLGLGTGSTTAYRGDYGNAAYQHSQAKGSAFTSGLYKITTNAEGHVTGATEVVKSDITGLGIPAQDTTYQSKAAEAGGTDVSLVTTGEKAAWNAKTSNIGTITGITMNGVSKGTSGNVDLGTVITAHQDISGKADKSATVSTVAYDTTNKKITKSINGTTSDVVTAATLKTDMGLSNVENKSSSTIRGELTSSNVTTALGYTPLDAAKKGAANGVAELGSDSKVPVGQIPSAFDEVLEYAKKENFPIPGESGKIYVDLATNLIYRWDSSDYVEISKSLALGTTGSTAFRGDYGNTAYTHAQAKGSAYTSGLYKITTNSEGHVTAATAVVKADITGLGIPGSDTNTHRPIQVNGTQVLGDNTTALNLKAGSNVSMSNDSGTVTINATDTTYTSKAAASEGTDVSLVTTGEKYTWNNKSDLALGTTASTAAAGNHTHNISIATDTGTSSISLAANTKYKLTAGGKSYVFTTPPDNNTTYQSKAAEEGGTDVSLVTTGEKAEWNSKTSNVGTITGITMNGVSKGTSGVVNLGTVITAHQDISGKVSGPSSSVNAHVATFDGTTGKVIKDSGFTIGKSVPSDAVFTDTTYSNATTSAAGLMSADDKTKLNGIAAGATANVGTITGITMNGASKGTSGNVDLGTVITAHQDISGKADKTATVSTVAYDTTNKKITKTINGTTSDVVTASKLKTDMGLANVENKSSATIRGELTSSNVTTALGFTPLDAAKKGAANGVAELGSDGKVPAAQLPAYVDDVLEYDNQASFPTTGETGKIYVALDNNKTYRWSGTAYVEISASLALGTTSSTAYRGDYGNAAYTHAVTNKGAAFSSGLYKITTNAEGHVTAATAVAKSDITGLGIPGSDTNTHRPIQVNGTEVLGNNTTALNLKAGSNVSLSNDSGTVTVNATDTTYSSKTAASGGTDVSLVTTGEKYTWNNKSNLAIGTSATTAAAGNHTHGISMATDSGTSSISLAANTKYKLTAGGQSYIFTTPPDNNTTYSFSDANPTLAWGTKSKVATVGGVDIHVTMPANPNTDHYAWGDITDKPSTYAPTIGSTASTAAAGNHTHSISIAADSGTNQLSLAANTKYKITAGGQSYIFTTPPDNNTTYSSKSAASGGTDVSLVTTGEKYTWNNKSNLAIGTTASTAAAGNHTHSTSIATSSSDNQLTLAANTKYAITAGGTSFVFTTPPDNNSWRGIQNNLTSDSTTESLSAAQGKALKAAVDGKAASGHTHATSIATSTADNQISLAANTKYAITAGGTSYVFTTPPDNNTTYSANNGVGLSGTTFYNSGVRSIATGGTNGTISVNTNGTSAEVAVKGLGSAAYTASTAYATSGHTHATSIATSTGTNQLTLAANTKYAITAGGTSYIFTTPPDNNTWRGIQNNLTSDSTTDSLSAAQGKELKSQIDGKAASGHTHSISIATDSGTNQLSMAANTKYKITAGGQSYIFTTPPDNNTTYSSKTAASGGTDVSLVTTGEKYTWNNKSNLAIGTTATTAAAGNHTHGISIATDSGTNQLTMAANTKYKITAGGQSYIFTTPPDNNTTYSSKTAASGGTDVSLVTTGEKYTWNNKSNLAIGTTATTAAAGNHTHGVSIATDSGTNQLTMAANTKYKLTAGGQSYIFTTPPDSNTWRSITDAVNSTASDVSASAKAVKTAYDLAASKTSNTGTVTSVAAGTGLSGGTITTSGTLSLATSGVTAGSYGPASNVDGTNGTTMSVPYITVDAYGRVTSISNKTYTSRNTDTNTDTNVTNTANTGTKYYVTGTTNASTNTGTQIFDTGIYSTTTAGQLNATTFKVNEKCVLQWNATDESLDFVFV